MRKALIRMDFLLCHPREGGGLLIGNAQIAAYRE